MTSPTEPPAKRLSFGLLLLISFVLFNGAYVIDQMFRWSDPLQGLTNGLIHIFFNGITWLLIILPWSLVIRALYRRRKWRRFRSQWVLAPSLLVMALTFATLVFSPPTPENRFRHFAHTELPENVDQLHYHFTGGGIADFGDTYYFQTTPAEVDRLITEMALQEDTFFAERKAGYSSVPTLPDCPNHQLWPDAKLYQRSENGWFYYLLHNAEKTEVYVFIACI